MTETRGLKRQLADNLRAAGRAQFDHINRNLRQRGMRRQYHFWPAGEAFDAWDVERLLELSRGLPVVDVPLSAIWEIDTVYWFDEVTGPATVRAVAEHVDLIGKADLSQPIILGKDGRVMDGMHRVARAFLEGLQTIKATRFEVDPPPDHRNCSPSDLLASDQSPEP